MAASFSFSVICLVLFSVEAVPINWIRLCSAIKLQYLFDCLPIPQSRPTCYFPNLIQFDANTEPEKFLGSEIVLMFEMDFT